MSPKIASILFAGVAAATLLPAPASVAAEPLRLLGRTDVPGFEGDFDHFAADVKGNRLFLAGEEKGTLEDRKSTRLNSSHIQKSRMPSSA